MRWFQAISLLLPRINKISRNRMRHPWTYCTIIASSGLLIQFLWPQARSPKVNVSEPPNQTSAIAKTPFLNWLDSEGIPVYRGFEVDDVATVPVGEWKRYSVKGAMVYLDGSEGVTTGVVWEIAPGQKSIPVHHIFEGRVVVVAGSGETKFWQDGGKPLTALWHHGTLFPLPMNVWYQFTNTGREPAR